MADQGVHGHLIDGGLNGRKLQDYLAATASVLDHAGDSPHLPFDPFQAQEQLPF
jgi:hypothetical protein